MPINTLQNWTAVQISTLSSVQTTYASFSRPITSASNKYSLSVATSTSHSAICNRSWHETTVWPLTGRHGDCQWYLLPSAVCSLLLLQLFGFTDLSISLDHISNQRSASCWQRRGSSTRVSMNHHIYHHISPATITVNTVTTVATTTVTTTTTTTVHHQTTTTTTTSTKTTQRNLHWTTFTYYFGNKQ